MNSDKTRLNSDGEFPFVEALPKREKSRWQTVRAHFEDIRSLVNENGMLIPVKLAADVANVSPQRILQLMESGKLLRIDVGHVHKHPFVGEHSFLEWVKSERKNGRPLKPVEKAMKPRKKVS